MPDPDRTAETAPAKPAPETTALERAVAAYVAAKHPKAVSVTVRVLLPDGKHADVYVPVWAA